MMFRDKDEVKRKLDTFVRNYYHSGGSSEYEMLDGEDRIGAAVRMSVRRAINQEINLAIKDFGYRLVEVLVSELYDNNDFEKDIGLR
jgi:hypothetical protein